ncbi:MAG TPA: carboxypeptidase-like regulatory domain-containing protein [Blastocatellia bacterium]
MWEHSTQSPVRQRWVTAPFIRRGIVLLALWLSTASNIPTFYGVPFRAYADGEPGGPNKAPVSAAASSNVIRNDTKNGTISGRVLDDAGKPVSTADVVVTPVGTRVGQRRTETDDDGKYSVTELDSAVYTVFVSAPSFVTSEDDTPGIAYRPGDTADIRLIKGGVITGNVNGPDGGPVVAVEVHAIRVKDSNGRPISQSMPAGTHRTDDRGIYRIYGLPSGSYLVYAGGPEGWSEGIAYIGDQPTYYPSSTIDTAEEVSVETGQEVTGVNINYRAERGHTVSGSVVDGVAAAPGRGNSFQVFLRQASSANIVAQSFVGQNSHDKAFSVSGVADGQYDVLAGKFGDGGLIGASPAVHITVKGGDVTGLSLVVGPAGSISGVVTLVPLPANQKAGCKPQGTSDLLKQTAVIATPDKAEGTLLFPEQGSSIWAAVDDKGHFTLSGFPVGTHRLELNMPGESWYVSSIQRTGDAAQDQAAPRTKTAPADSAAALPQKKATENGGVIELKAGEKVTDLVVTVSEGAAMLKGQVKTSTAKGAAKAPPASSGPLRVYLVPDDPDRAKNPLCFLESPVSSKDGSFEIHRVPPGKYKAVAQPDPLEKDKPGPVRRASWDPALRKRLIDSAAKLTDVIELKTCGNITDSSIVYDPARTKPNAPPAHEAPPK